MNRRRFVSAGLVGLTAKAERPLAGGFVDSSMEMGHRLRDREAKARPRETVTVPVVIVGGGMAGLCAGWRLLKRGFGDFVILEMEQQAGGNSRWGENEISAYPWAAHYLPVPSRGEGRLVHELMEELGVYQDGHWEERHLCHSPQERLYLHGRWQEGLEPEIAATRADRQQYKRFHEQMAEFEASGEFVIPTERGHRKRREWDRLSMTAWMQGNGYDSKYLHWLVDYACRDDYGARAKDTSAWAGIHYFAARGEQEDKGPLTWAEGNGWIARRLIEKVRKQLRTGAMVQSVRQSGRRQRIETATTVYEAEIVIWAAPAFLLPYVMEEAPRLGAEYSPWITANLTLDRWPEEAGLPVAWDNVIYGSPALGYVVATHQSLRTRLERTVWTYYWALADGSPQENRRQLVERPWNYWKEAILSDLERAHRDIRQCVTRIDIMRMGHAMVRPEVGFLFSEERERLARAEGPFLLANSDVSGLSIFEEAQYRGVGGAEKALRRLGRGG
ncbi:MAG: FAD-dependent oxidoreductase [Bryobacterales bacterium]|nr:FAD-dependent oxidoreductase [Bryobacterales bacterium]